jgi:hypothetical protein
MPTFSPNPAAAGEAAIGKDGPTPASVWRPATLALEGVGGDSAWRWTR